MKRINFRTAASADMRKVARETETRDSPQPSLGRQKWCTQRRGGRRGAFPTTSCWSRRRAEHKQVQGDGNIRLRTPIPQNCQSRERGNPWSYISARDTILVRTKTRRQGATSLCLRAFVRTILPIVRPMGSRFRGNDELKGSRRGAEAAEGHSPQRHAGAEGVQSTTRFSIHRAT